MKIIVGIDEVGRGPLAGPVTVCVVVCENQMYTKLKRDKNLPPLGKDSKKLLPTERQKYAKYLKSLMSRRHLDTDSYRGETSVTSVKYPIGISYGVVHVSNKMIDKKGISFCIREAIEKGLKKLKINPVRGREGPQRASASNGIKPKQTEIRLDGLLKAPKEFKNQKTIIKGDEKEKIITWASILAKVSRDALMVRMSKKYPKYGFEMHKGYGTAMHRKMIKKYGLSAIHRRSFCKNIKN